ncbi:hypothetical protein AMTRI_Chr12g237200 [Amborella trichopoda]
MPATSLLEILSFPPSHEIPPLSPSPSYGEAVLRSRTAAAPDPSLSISLSCTISKEQVGFCFNIRYEDMGFIWTI